MARLSIKQRIGRSIALRKGEVVMRGDFRSLGSRSQISRALRALIAEGRIVRLGYGVYAKARPSSLSGKPVPRDCLAVLAQEALIKMGVAPKLGSAQAAYAEGRTPDVPMHVCFNTGNRRISRKITVGRTTVRYENDFSEKRRTSRR